MQILEIIGCGIVGGVTSHILIKTVSSLIYSLKSIRRKQIEKKRFVRGGESMMYKSTLRVVLHKQNTKRHFGWLWRKESFWIGCHYSKECKRYCLNLIPCLTIWWTKKGGLPVDLKRM